MEHESWFFNIMGMLATGMAILIIALVICIPLILFGLL